MPIHPLAYPYCYFSFLDHSLDLVRAINQIVVPSILIQDCHFSWSHDLIAVLQIGSDAPTPMPRTLPILRPHHTMLTPIPKPKPHPLVTAMVAINPHT